MMWLTFALMSSGCVMGLPVPGSWLLRPTTCTEMIFIATLVTFLAPHRAFFRWVRRSTFTACLTLATLGPLALWPWPFLCLKVLISSMVVAIATPPLDRWLKSLMVASCYLVCSSSLLNVTVSFCAVCVLTHFLTSKCFCLIYKWAILCCSYCWHMVKPFIAVLMLYMEVQWVLGAMGAPYNGWAWMWCSVAMAGACTKHQPCYWSKTSLLLTKNSKKSLYLNFTLALLTLHFNILPLDFNWL